VILPIPDAYGVLIAAISALAGSLAATALTHFERRSATDGALPAQAAFVAVVTSPGQEAKGTQLLHDAGGRSMERMRQRQILTELSHAGDDIKLRTGFPIS
jgi:hypothetical protein